jgi:hypothetical protein
MTQQGFTVHEESLLMEAQEHQVAYKGRMLTYSRD